jgi:hypothetical protein
MNKHHVFFSKTIPVKRLKKDLRTQVREPVGLIDTFAYRLLMP